MQRNVKMKDVFWFGILPMRIPKDYKPNTGVCIQPQIYFPMGAGHVQYNNIIVPVFKSRYAQLLDTELEFTEEFDLEEWANLTVELGAADFLLLKFWLNCYTIETGDDLLIQLFTDLSPPLNDNSGD